MILDKEQLRANLDEVIWNIEEARITVSEHHIVKLVTVAKYTENYILLISSSKAFSYAGQRIGMMVISDTLFNKKAPDFSSAFYYFSLSKGANVNA